MEQLSQILIAIFMKLNKVQDKETIGLGSDKNIFVKAINLRAPSRSVENVEGPICSLRCTAKTS